MKFLRFLGFLPFVTPSPAANPVVEERNLINRFLRMTADVIETHGWAQGVSQTKDGRYCTYGAMLTVKYALKSQGVPWEMAQLAHVKSMQRLGKVVTGGTNVMTWNDLKATSAAQVVAGLRKAADYKPRWRL